MGWVAHGVPKLPWWECQPLGALRNAEEHLLPPRPSGREIPVTGAPAAAMSPSFRRG